MKKFVLSIIVLLTIAGNMAGKENGKDIALHLPSGEKVMAGYHYDLTGSTVHGSATPVSFTDKFVCFWIGLNSVSLSRTDKWYTEDPTDAWTIYTFEITRSEDDAWLSFEVGF